MTSGTGSVVATSTDNDGNGAPIAAAGTISACGILSVADSPSETALVSDAASFLFEDTIALTQTTESNTTITVGTATMISLLLSHLLKKLFSSFFLAITFYLIIF